MAVFRIVLVCLLAAFVSADWMDGDDGVDRRNGDLANMPIQLQSGAKPRDCAKLCVDSAECKGWAFCKENCSGSAAPQCYLKAQLLPQSYDPCRVSGLGQQPELLPPKFRPLPVGAIKPQGWLLEQLQTQAMSLSGHLPLFWGDVMNSSWIGGKADGGLHERTPYWLNGFVPLAFQLNDPKLLNLVQQYVTYILDHQSNDGWLGPDDSKDGNQYWSKYPMLFALRQYYEANSTDTRIIPAITKFLQAVQKRMFTTALGVTWSAARWQDLVLTVHWMLEYHPGGNEQMLWDLAELIHDQGFDWKGFYGKDTFPTDAVAGATLFTHGVNNGQAIKSEGVWYRQSKNHTDFESSYVRMEKLDKYHGQASGIFACDEHLAGKMPSRGTELCTVVETMFSYEVLFAIQGDPIFAERAEKLAYNALPATITPDMWAHQYLQQSNEMNAVHSDDHVWTHDGPDSTIYGLAPNYGCCTANFNQGWPKYTENLIMEHGSEDGFVVGMYAPVQMDYKLPSGVSASLNVQTDYPFNDTIVIAAICEKELLLSLRIPSWTNEPTVTVNGTVKSQPPPVPGTLYDVMCIGPTEVVLQLPMSIKVERRYNNAASIFRGPLLYGLQIQEDFKVLNTYQFDSKDYQVTPGTPWNYAIQLRSNATDKDLVFQNSGFKKGTPPFSNQGSPVQINAMGRVLDSWGLAHNAADAPPMSPVQSSNPLKPITLLPFGATDLRIAELPVLSED